MLTLAHLRNGHPYAQLAAGFGIGTTTAYRYVAEAVELLAAPAPTLAEAARTASTKAFVLLDGTLLPIDRIAADRPFYSGEHKKHGMNVQVLADPSGRLLWASPALPGSVHDVRAAREHGIIATLAEAGGTCWADKGYRGAASTVRVPYWDQLTAFWPEESVSHRPCSAVKSERAHCLRHQLNEPSGRCAPSRRPVWTTKNPRVSDPGVPH